MPYKILTIEDNRDIRRLIAMTMEFKNHEVIEAADGAEGLALARSQKPQLILLDVMMRGLDGLGVARQLADDPVLQHIPVIMISALGSEHDIAAGLKAGAKAYLVKPFSPRELLDTAAQLVLAARQRSASVEPGPQEFGGKAEQIS
jgi:DNA-binding response OmpR family regulator